MRLVRNPAGLEIMTISPLLSRFMPGVTDLTTLKAPFTLTSKIDAHSSLETSSMNCEVCPLTPPAACTAISIWPRFEVPSISLTKPDTAAKSVMSNGLATMVPPLVGAALATVSFRPSARISVAKTIAPRAAKLCAMVLPIPPTAPVIKTDFPVKSTCMSLILCRANVTVTLINWRVQISVF